MTTTMKKILGVSLISLVVSLPFATDANAYYYGHRYGGVIVAGPYYPYGYAPAYYAPPPYPYAPPPPYAYAPPPYPYAPAPVYASPVIAPAIGVGIHIR